MGSKRKNTKGGEIPAELVGGVTRAISHLFPSVETEFWKVHPSKVAATKEVLTINPPQGGGIAEIYLPIDDSQSGIFKVNRKSTPFTEQERSVLRRINWALPRETLQNSQVSQAEQLALGYSLEHILAFRLLRNVKVEAYDTPALILRILQNLTFERYEGAPCTTAFLFCVSTHVHSLLDRLTQISEFSFEPFSPDLSIAEDFFKQPLTFRYVDGANAAYLIDGRKRILGVIRVRDATSFDVVDRFAGKHFQSVLELAGENSWFAYAAKHGDIWARTHGGLLLHWNKNHWRVKDPVLLEGLLERFGCSKSFAAKLTEVVFTLSEMRMGTGILVLNQAEDERPKRIGYIDNSAAGASLVRLLGGKSLDEVVQSHHALSLLSSDGLTTFDSTGKLIDAGEIISLEKRENDVRKDSVSGGGRTQSCRAASQYGLALKVSEDGPITVFRAGSELVKI